MVCISIPYRHPRAGGDPFSVSPLSCRLCQAREYGMPVPVRLSAFLLDSHFRGNDDQRRTQDAGRRTQDSGPRTQDSGLRTQDSGLRTRLRGRHGRTPGGQPRSWPVVWGFRHSPTWDLSLSQLFHFGDTAIGRPVEIRGQFSLNAPDLCSYSDCDRICSGCIAST